MPSSRARIIAKASQVKKIMGDQSRYTARARHAAVAAEEATHARNVVGNRTFLSKAGKILLGPTARSLTKDYLRTTARGAGAIGTVLIGHDLIEAGTKAMEERVQPHIDLAKRMQGKIARMRTAERVITGSAKVKGK